MSKDTRKFFKNHILELSRQVTAERLRSSGIRIEKTANIVTGQKRSSTPSHGVSVRAAKHLAGVSMIKKSKDPNLCQASVHNPGTTVTFHQCRFKPKRDGFCNIHHPDAEEKRREKSNTFWEKKQKQDPLRLAYARIEQLEKENKELKKKSKDSKQL